LFVIYANDNCKQISLRCYTVQLTNRLEQLFGVSCYEAVDA